MERHIDLPATRLLVPLDGSRLAEAVLPAVERLAAAGATPVLLHVLERGAPTTVHGERHLCAAAEATAYLQGVAGRLRNGSGAVELHTHEAPEGDVASSIVAHAEEEHAGLIVLCTHGGGGVRDLLVGSIAQQVLRRGAIPVLLVRPDREGNAPPFAPRTVLVPLDGTTHAEAALAPAADLARALGAALHLVMVVATLQTVRGDRQPGALLLPATARAELDLQQDDAQGYLDALAAQLRLAGLPVTTEVRRGDAAVALSAEAAEPGVGLVVVATHGRAGLQALWAGSVTARLLARTRAPVLLLRTIDR
jgi:nucleotide-binding universal stress UspA family protein